MYMYTLLATCMLKPTRLTDMDGYYFMAWMHLMTFLGIIMAFDDLNILLHILTIKVVNSAEVISLYSQIYNCLSLTGMQC